MARLPRFVIPGQPQHAKPCRALPFGGLVCVHTQEFPASLLRGNNWLTIFAADADYQFFRDATNKGWALGSDRFQAEIEALSARRVVPRGRGRPRVRAVEMATKL